MRLLDEEDVIKVIQGLKLRTAQQTIRAIGAINKIPTAFDVEKVLNELKHEESKALRRYSESKGTAYAFSDKCSCDNWAKAIGIIKRGGR